MKAALLTGIRQFKIGQVPEPKIVKATDVLIRIKTVGVCGSDIHYYTTGRIGSQIIEFPFIVGHEAAGIVEQVGKKVTRVIPGQRIAIDPAVYCGHCDQCRAGRENTCRKLLFLGCPKQLEGALCEYIVLPEICCFPINDSTTFEQATLSEPLAIAVYAVERSRLPVKASVAILGAGPIGMSVFHVLRTKNVGDVFVTDKIPERLAFSQKLHPKWCGNPERTDVVKEISQAEPLLMDVVYECSGDKDAFDDAIKLLKPGGTLAIVGIPEIDEISFPIHELRRKEITIINIRRQAHCTQKAIDLLECRKINMDAMVTHHLSLAETRQAFDLVADYRDGVMKAMISMDYQGTAGKLKSHPEEKMESLVIGLDSSTTGTKAIAFDKKGNVVAHASEPIPLSSPQPNYYEQDPGDWWVSAQRALQKITRQIDPERIVALAVSNQRETFVPLGSDGNCLRPAIVWLDERCKDVVESFAQKIGLREIHRITGKPIDYAPVVYRLAWMKKHEPDLFRKIRMVCDVHTWLVWKLTSSFKTSWASADPLGLFDLENKKWSPVILSALELTEAQLPAAYCPGTVIGRVTKEASELTGLSMGTLIVAGGGDGQAAGLGANALTSERAYLNLGTAVVAGVYGTRYRTSEAFRTMGAVSESGYYYECSLRAGTFAIDWFLKNILNIEPVKQPGIYKQLEQDARQIPAGSDGLLHLPYLCGAMNPYWDINARGAFVGLSSSHNRGHMYRSIWEGIAFEQLFAINAVEKTIGARVREFVAVGGGADSDLWCHIMADVTGKIICLPEHTEASGLGAAIAAAVGAGWYPTFKQAAQEMAGAEKKIKPDVQNHEKYRQRFAAYQTIYPGLKTANASPS